MPFIGTQPEVGGYSVLDALTASATASYTLQKDSANFVPNSANQLLVSLNGVIQKPGSSFTVSGSTLTFSSALTSSDSIDFILAMGEPLLIGTPSDNTVTTSKIATNAVSTAKIADDAVTGAKIENNPTIAGTLGVTGTGGVSGGTAAVAYGDADDLVVGNGSGNRGMSIYTGTSNAGSIYFSDASSGTGQYDGYISYNHNNRTMVAYSGINYGLNIDGVNKTVRLTDGGTQRLRIDNDGIKFGTDSAAVNALDDYEEGTWTPNCATAGVSGSYSIQLGRYIKIGNLVQCIFNLTTSGSYTGSTSSVFQLGGLPFASKYYDGSLYAGGNIGYYFNINTVDTVKQIVYQIPSGSASAFELKGTADNSGEISIVVSNFNSNSVIRGQLVYHTA